MHFARTAALSVILALLAATTGGAQTVDDIVEEPAVEPAEPAPLLELTIVNLGDGEGPIRIAIDTEETWFVKGADPILTYDVPLDGEAAVLQVDDLEPGVYAVRVYHDEDGDGELGTNFLGIPNEPYGFSGERTDRMRPRSFDYAQFTLDEPTKMTITLR
jgi:uncharacterized protein (DUF2141 family)